VWTFIIWMINDNKRRTLWREIIYRWNRQYLAVNPVNSTLRSPSISACTAARTLVPKLMMWKRKELMMKKTMFVNTNKVKNSYKCNGDAIDVNNVPNDTNRKWQRMQRHWHQRWQWILPPPKWLYEDIHLLIAKANCRKTLNLLKFSSSRRSTAFIMYDSQPVAH